MVNWCGRSTGINSDQLNKLGTGLLQSLSLLMVVQLQVNPGSLNHLLFTCVSLVKWSKV
jgi:hypothetical protein